MSIGVMSEAERRMAKCPHVLEQLDPKEEDGFRYRCIRCGKYLKIKNGVVIPPHPKAPKPPIYCCSATFATVEDWKAHASPFCLPRHKKEAR